MVFVQILLVIFLLVFIMFKIYDINRKIKNGEELTGVENFASNLGTGLIKILFFFIKSIIGFFIPLMIIFLPSVLILVLIAVQVSMDLVPFAVIIAAVVSLFMYLMIVIVCVMGNRKKVKKENNINEENNNE